MKKALIFLVLVALCAPLSVWAEVARYNSGGDDTAPTMAIGPSGNVYVTGQSCQSQTNCDYLTVAYDRNLNQLWTARYNGLNNGNDLPSAIATDSSGNIYVTGYTAGNGTGDDYTTIAYDPNGNELWVARYNGPGNGPDSANALAIGPTGNVYVTGFSSASLTADWDYATVAYDPNGNELWVARYNGPGNGADSAQALAIGPSGDIYVTGFSYGSGTNFDYATVAYDSGGNERGIVRYNGPASSRAFATSIAVGPYGAVYVTGYSHGRTNVNFLTIKYGGGSR